jgi:molybdopterin molybdotransferase
MIAVEKAIQIISKTVETTSFVENVATKNALNSVLSEDVISPINIPPFRQSAVDGYALNSNGSSEYRLVGETKAGDRHKTKLETGEALRIFTGAPVPESANTVVMQEQTTASAGTLSIPTEVCLNTHIRPLGEQVMKGEIALKKGTKLNPSGIAFLSSLGITEIKAYKKPTVAIVVTGNELAAPGMPLDYGQIYESNSTMLEASLVQLGYKNISIHKVKDDYTDTVNVLDKVISTHDVVLISGGISVGDYDFVKRALKNLNICELFYKVRQKPGKPLFYGKKEQTLIFALPGNPAAALSCFYIYVHPALELFSGNTMFSLKRVRALPTKNHVKKGDRAAFLKAVYKNGMVEILDGQSSSMLHTFAMSNALVYLPEKTTSITKNEPVEVILLPVN